MSTVDLLSKIGLLRPVRRRAFCPACRGWLEGDDAGMAVSPRKIARPAVAAATVLVVATVAWIVVIHQSRSMGDMVMGLGSPGAGARYGVSCIGCTAALMTAAVLIGMSSFGWMAILSGLVPLYKLAQVPGMGQRTVLAVAVAALGVLYAFGGKPRPSSLNSFRIRSGTEKSIASGWCSKIGRYFASM